MNWKQIRRRASSGDPVEVKRSDFDDESLEQLPEDMTLMVLDNDPQLWISRDGAEVFVQIEESIRAAYWDHKYNLRVFAEATMRAVRRLVAEGRPYDEAEVEETDPDYYFIRWTLRLDSSLPGRKVIESAQRAFEEVWERAERILEDSDSALVLGKDTGEHLGRLREIAKALEDDLGYHVYLVKEQPDRPGQTVVQKVLRYALSSKFVIVENTDPSGHLYEFPHVAKMAECVVAVLQESGRGATWMFEDGYARHRHWRKFEYAPGQLREAVMTAAQWAEELTKEFAKQQRAVLPWLSAADPETETGGGQGVRER